MAIAAGTRLDRYEILSPIGAGGMGEVYLALDTRLDRRVALKLLPAQFTTDADRVWRFVQEAKAASALNHPNIITIHEIGQTSIEAGGTHFIATEFIEGQTLRHQMASTRMTLPVALDVAMQMASALTAAHAAGIVHRDIKPENVMVRPDGLVKVLDFGLAKLTESPASPTDTDAPTVAGVNTETGAILGTPRYMSPEQARGEKVDGRTDIFSLGVVLFEMIAGRSPFEGATAGEVIAAILHQEPPPLQRYTHESPEALEWIVTKALAKDREQRYQGVKDLALDLRGLKHRLELEAERERTRQPEMKEKAAEHHLVAASGQGASAETAQVDAAHTGEAAPTTSSGKILLGEIKRHQLGVSLTLAALIVVAAALFFYFNRQPALTDKDTILLTDFVNPTGDPVFDGTLKQALAVDLGQSPFLNIFPEEQVKETLRLMSRSPDERVTSAIGREICQRQGLKALLVGSITSLGRNYVIMLEAINGQTGEAIASQKIEAESKEQVIKKLGEATTKLREKLGESLSSIQKFDAPIEQATTSSLEALKALSVGTDLLYKAKSLEAIPFFKRAIDLDPNFALAYLRLGGAYGGAGQRELAAECGQKAYDLRERVSEREKLIISSAYIGATGEVDKVIEALELWKRMYPRDLTPHNNLAVHYNGIGQYEKAIEPASEALRLNPNSVFPYVALATAFIGLNRFEEAKEIYQRALARIGDATYIHAGFYQIAFVQGQMAAMRQQIDWMSGKPDEYAALGWQARAAAFSGQLRRSHEFASSATDLALGRNLKEVAAAYASEDALRDAVFGNCQRIKEDMAKALSIGRSNVALRNGATALAHCGEAGQAQSLADELVRRNPKDTLNNAVLLPVIRAALELHRGHPDQAIQFLQAAIPYEAGVGFWPTYLRGNAYLRWQKGAEAAAEFQKMLDHRGWGVLSPLYPLAHLGLARAAMLQGDTTKARKSYQDFFALWKDADADLPILIEAKKEYEKVK